MYIAPNSTIELMQGVPLEASYIHTLYWANKAAQNTYFAGKVYKSFNNYTYQKHNGQSVKLSIEMDEALTQCNYLRFKNTSFEDKWFYAFITDFEYISNNVTRVIFSLDVMQTWYFDYTVNPCLVLREHTRTDNIGDNIIPEGLETGEYLQRRAQLIGPSTEETGYLVLATQDPTGGQSTGGIVSNVYCGLYFAFAGSLTTLKALIQSYQDGVTGSTEPIIAIYQIPKFFMGDPDSSTYEMGTGYYTVEISDDTGYTDFIMPNDSAIISGYTPKNNKLYTYPYDFYTLVSPNGSSIALKREFFSGTTKNIMVAGCVMPQPECLFIPMGYNGLAVNYSYALEFNNFPTCAVASDAYSAWWAQNKASYPSGVMDTTVSQISNGFNTFRESTANLFKNIGNSNYVQEATKVDPWKTLGEKVQRGYERLPSLLDTMGDIFAIPATVAGVAQNWESSIGNVGNELAAKENHKAIPDTVVGNISNSIYNALHRNTAVLYHTQINKQHAKVIDSFFDRYGYRVETIKQPVFHNRSKWTYLQTSGATLTTDIPFQYEQQICNILDNGITFWVNPSEVGNYSLNNALLT